MYFQAVEQGFLFGFLKDIITTRAKFYFSVLQDGEFISSRGFSEKTHPTSTVYLSRHPQTSAI